MHQVGHFIYYRAVGMRKTGARSNRANLARPISRVRAIRREINSVHLSLSCATEDTSTQVQRPHIILTSLPSLPNVRYN